MNQTCINGIKPNFIPEFDPFGPILSPPPRPPHAKSFSRVWSLLVARHCIEVIVLSYL